MEVVKGTIQKISVKEPKDGQFGKFAGYGVQVNGEWYNGLANEKNGEVWPVDKNGNKMKEGQEIELLLEEKNGYKNIVTKSTMIISGGQSQAEPEKKSTEQGQVFNGDVKFKSALWVNCLDSAINIANKLEEVKNINSKEMIRIANTFYEEALKK